ncbi:MAG TPA: delta-60 repeat domain-containing protein [Verrucomicrobiae bacterium]|jgi:uncharacterized delta-60 repeat protein
MDDGRTLVHGRFDFANGLPRQRLVRLLADGQVDTNFNVAIDPALTFFGTLLPSSNATTLALGSFADGMGPSRRGLFRIRSDGSLDPAFNPQSSFVFGAAVALQADGKILAAVSVPAGATNATPLVVRLNSDGTIDPGFDSAMVVAPCEHDAVYALQSLPNNQVLVRGAFHQPSGLLSDSFIRLNGDGSLDANFAVTNFVSIREFAGQPDGRILVSYDNQAIVPPDRGLARLLTNGQLDPSFNAPKDTNISYFGISPQSNGAAYVVMSVQTNAFYDFSSVHLVRLKSDGVVDDAFQPSILSNRFTGTYRALPDGRILASLTDGSVVRLLPSGALDPTFNASVASLPEVVSVVALSNGNLAISGLLAQAGTNQVGSIAVLQSNGLPVPGFTATLSAGAPVYRLLAQTDGKLVVLGSRGVAGAAVTRLNSDGSIDAGFGNPFATDSFASDGVVQPDGKLLVCGGFIRTNSVTPSFLQRLNSDGSIDPGFAATTEIEGNAFRLLVQADGRLLLSGSFSQTNGAGPLTVVRLTASGAIDPTFNAVSATNVNLDLLSLQPDGRIFARRSSSLTLSLLPCQPISNGPPSSFTSAPEAAAIPSAGAVFRLNSDGSFDSTFQPALGSNSSVLVAMPLADGRILVGGRLYNTNGVWLGNTLRLESDGRIDLLFAVESELGSVVNALLVEADGAVVLGGSFLSVNGTSRLSLARVIPTGRSRLSIGIGSGVRLVGEPGRAYRVETSADLANWTLLTNVVATNTSIPVSDPGAATGTNRFYRALLINP